MKIEVFLRVVAEARFERHAQELVAQAHRLRSEDALVHERDRLVDHGLEVHEGEDVALDIDSGCDLDQLEPVLRELEHAPFGHVEHGLAAAHRDLAAEGLVLDLVHELARLAFGSNAQLPVRDLHFQPAGREGAGVHDLLGVLADVDEAARTGELRPELAHVEVAFLVRLRESEKSGVEAAAVVEVELVRLVDDGMRIDRGTEIQAARRDTADNARLGRKREEIDDLLFVGNARDAFGHADAEIDHAVGGELESGAPRDDLALVQRHRLERSHGHLHFAAVGRVVLGREGLPVLLGLRDHDAVHQDAGHLDVARIERARSRQRARPGR